MTGVLRACLPTPTWLRHAIVPVLAFVATVTDHGYLADFWHHLARGRAIAAQGALVNRDLFTCTVAGQPLQDVNWLTQLGYYGLFELGGLRLVQVVNSLLIAMTFGWLVRLGQLRSGSLLAAVLAGGLAFFGSWDVLTIRPQTLSMLLFVILFDVLGHSRLHPRLLLLAPPLVALWANLHGAFPVGLVLIGCYWVSAAASAWSNKGWKSDVYLRWLTAALAASCLATLVNPYGMDIYRYVGSTSTVAYQRQIAEWVAPGPDRLIGKMWLMSVGLVACLLVGRWWLRRTRPALLDMLVIGFFLALSCGSVRMVPWWLLATAPLLAELVVAFAPQLAVPDAGARRPTWVVGGVFALLVLAVVFSLPGLDRFNPLLGPTRRGQRVEEDLDSIQHHLAEARAPGNVYSHFEWGEYLCWAAPGHKIFMDGRIEIYPDDVWEKYSTITFGRDCWQQILDDYRVDYLVLDADYHGPTGLLERVARSPHWQHVATSHSALLFKRAAP